MEVKSSYMYDNSFRIRFVVKMFCNHNFFVYDYNQGIIIVV